MTLCALWSTFMCIISFVSHCNSAKQEEMVLLMWNYVSMDFYIIWYSLIIFQKEGNAWPVLQSYHTQDGKTGARTTPFRCCVGEGSDDMRQGLCRPQRRKNTWDNAQSTLYFTESLGDMCAVHSVEALPCLFLIHLFIHPSIYKWGLSAY